MAQTHCRWSTENSFCIGPTSWASLETEATVLDPQKYSSVSEAVKALNKRIVDCPRLCLAFSKKVGAYYLLWPSEMPASEVKSLTIGLTNSLQMRALLEQRETDKLLSKDKLNNDNGRNSSSSSSLVSASTTDTASRHASPDEKNGRALNLKAQSTLKSAGYATSQEAPNLRGQSRTIDEANIVEFELPVSMVSDARYERDTLLVDERSRLFQDTGPNRTPTEKTPQLQSAEQRVPHECRYDVSGCAEKTQLQSPQQQTPLSFDFEMAEVPFASSTKMSIDWLRMDQTEFDPNSPPLKSRLSELLGLSDSASIEKLEDNAGSFNDGVWMVSDANSLGLVLKLVPHQRVHEARKTDTEKYVELQERCPKIASELSLTVPTKILQLIGPDGRRCKDLLVMRKAPGLQMTQHLFHKYHAIYTCSAGDIFEQTSKLLTMFWEFGRFLQILHRVYSDGERSMQHGDCQPSNVFYDEVSGDFTLVDVADFGFGPFLALGGEDDVEHFVWGLCSLKPWYGEAMIDNCANEFRKGYSAAANQK